MKSLTQPTIELFEACVRLSDELQECFRQERLSLIEFKTDSILENNLRKDQLLRELTTKRQELREVASLILAGQSPEFVFAGEDLDRWNELEHRWTHSWDRLYRSCSSNQDFLKHSLKNLDRLSENLSRLFGLHSTYSAKGTRVESKPKGNVVEGRY